MFLSNKEVEKLSIKERKEYYQFLREQCLLLKDKQLKIGQPMIKSIYPLIRNYHLEIEGEENIPKDSNVLFLVNHSNSHDIFTAYEVLSLLERKGSVMVATDCLTPATTTIFNISNATLLDRRKKEDRENSVLELSKKILEGKDGVIFGESTWNLHPTLLMHNIKLGVSKISLITGVPIIPTIFEYIEEKELVKSEKDLYRKCIIRFGKPILINFEDNLIHQTNEIKKESEKIRKKIWKDYNCDRERVEEIDPLLYLNHTYMKKFKALGFTYHSEKEQEYLLFLEGETKENEYHLSKEGEFSPGIIEKDYEWRKVLKK